MVERTADLNLEIKREVALILANVNVQTPVKLMCMDNINSYFIYVITEDNEPEMVELYPSIELNDFFRLSTPDTINSEMNIIKFAVNVPEDIPEINEYAKFYVYRLYMNGKLFRNKKMISLNSFW